MMKMPNQFFSGLGLVLFGATVSAGDADIGLEMLRSDDIEYRSFQGYIEAGVAAGELRMDVSVTDLEVEYRPNAPVDPFGVEEVLDDVSRSLGARWRYQAGDFRADLQGSVFEGFRSHSDIWIDAYYRQQYGFGGIPGVSYQNPDPGGSSLSGTLRWEYLPATAFVSLNAGWQGETVAPGYEVVDEITSFRLEKTDTYLNTWRVSLDFENALNRRVRVRNALALTKTDRRDPRYGWSGQINVALSDHLISRSKGSYNREEPDFESWSISETLEWNFHGPWYLSGTVRWYDDTGQIESAFVVSSAAPALESRSFILSLKWRSEDGTRSVSFGGGPYETDYADVGLGTERFLHLYQDRDWTHLHLAAHIEF